MANEASGQNRSVLRIYVNADETEDPANPVAYTITQDLRDNDIRIKKIDSIQPPKLWAARGEVFHIKFILCDNTGKGLRFEHYNENDPLDPIWIARGTTCPQAPGLDGFRIVKKNKRKLTIENPLPAARIGYVYRLKIVEEDGVTSRDFDPVIQNGGGTQRKSFGEALAELFHSLFR